MSIPGDPFRSRFDQHDLSRALTATCKSCSAIVEWVEWPSGKIEPIDPGVHPNGTIAVTGFGCAHKYTERDAELGRPRRRTHYDTCTHPFDDWLRRQAELRKAWKRAREEKRERAERAARVQVIAALAQTKDVKRRRVQLEGGEVDERTDGSGSSERE